MDHMLTAPSVAISLKEAQRDVMALFKDRILVGHALKCDFKVLMLGHDRRHVRDTSCYKPFRAMNGGRTPSLKKLAKHILGLDIQGASHCSVRPSFHAFGPLSCTLFILVSPYLKVEDALVAMLLYRRHKVAWEASLRPKKQA